MRFLRSFLLLSAALATTRAADTNIFHWTGKVPAGRTIEIKGVNGSVRAETTTGPEVDVTARKTGRRSDPSNVQLQVVEHDQGVTICAVYPSDSRPNECKPGSAGRMNTHNNDVSVDFTVRVPAGVRFVGRTVNGEVDANALTADVDASTVNGKIHISTDGNARANTVNGEIVASAGAAAWNDHREFSTVNGSITLNLPAGINTDVHASTVNGHISTDFPLTVRGQFIGRKIDGTIGTGGRQLKLTTVNGNITLHQSRSRTI